MPSGTKDVHFYIGSNSGIAPYPAHNFYIDDLQVMYPGTVTVQEPVDNYRFGFNSQERTMKWQAGGILILPISGSTVPSSGDAGI